MKNVNISQNLDAKRHQKTAKNTDCNYQEREPKKTVMDKSKYPPNWDELSLQLREEVGWCCEWCGAKYGEPHPDTGSIVVLSVAHLDNDTTHNERSNLAVLCARCHLRYDAKYHAQNARQTRIRKKKLAAQQNGQMELFE